HCIRRVVRWRLPGRRLTCFDCETALSLSVPSGVLATDVQDLEAALDKAVAADAPTLAPIDEEAQRALMVAYDGAGRRWDAVAVYESLRSRLDDEYAAAPDVQTTTLYRRLLTGQADPLAGGLHHLVRAGTRFLGRRREIEELVTLCMRNRLVTLSGPGGCRQDAPGG
ncbi:MAG TPA: bacterial transcriptional activator domain-containing protein, partial [Propionibacteriaceae bacterium]